MPGAVAPLKLFGGAGRREKKILSGGGPRRRLRWRWATAVAGKYAEMASELVAGVKKTEASLNRLKDRRAAKGWGSAAGGGDDGEKGPSDTGAQDLQAAAAGRGGAQTS